jgi:cullin 1
VNENPVNMGSTKTPELLAKYSDMLLKKGKLSAEEKQLEDKLSNVVRVHAPIHMHTCTHSYLRTYT